MLADDVTPSFPIIGILQTLHMCCYVTYVIQHAFHCVTWVMLLIICFARYVKYVLPCLINYFIYNTSRNLYYVTYILYCYIHTTCVVMLHVMLYKIMLQMLCYISYYICDIHNIMYLMLHCFIRYIMLLTLHYFIDNIMLHAFHCETHVMLHTFCQVFFI